MNETHACDRQGPPAVLVDKSGDKPFAVICASCSMCGRPLVFRFEPGDHSESLDVALKRLAEVDEFTLPSTKALLEADDGKFFGLDFLALAALKRSMSLTAGFRSMLAARNLICAGALLRLELDTALRFSAAWLVADPHQFGVDVLAGKQIRDMKDRDGERLTDRYLVNKLSEQYEWVSRVYAKTSGYVHLSSTHVMSVADTSGEAEDGRDLRFLIGVEDKPLPDWIYIEMCDGFRASAQILLRYVNGWWLTKANPELVKR